ncbi:MAG TPA: NnrS family protein [Vicinamibacteria bacterium]|nr:NnrS family protein [Vicinamibacteria bacterium]
MPFVAASLAFALTFGATLGALNLARLTGTWGVLHRPSVWLHGYVQAFGFLALFIMGFAFHAVPRLAAAPLAHPRLVPVTFGAQLAGVLAVAAALIAPSPVRALWIAGAVGLLAAAGQFLTIVGATLRASPRRHDSFAPWMIAGAAWLVTSAALALLAAIRDDTAWHHLLWPAALDGFVASWIFGAGRRLLPISLGFQPRWPRWERPAFVVYQAGVALWSLGAAPWPGSDLGPARAAGAACLLVATPLAAATIGLGGPRWPWARAAVDRTYERYVLAAWIWLFVALAAGPGWSLGLRLQGELDSTPMLDFARHTIALGFATQLLMGIGGRFIPVFMGRRLWSARAHLWAFWLLNAGVCLRGLEAAVASGLWPAAWPLIGLAGPPAVAAFLLFSANMFQALRRPSPSRGSFAAA